MNRRVGCMAWIGLAVGALFLLGIVGAIWGNDTGQVRSTPAPALRTAAPTGPVLRLGDWNCTFRPEVGYATTEGVVTNIGSSPLENVQALVTWKAADGTFITSDDALIEYDPLLAGQTSPWKVLTRYNPAMSSCVVEFKTLFGRSLDVE